MRTLREDGRDASFFQITSLPVPIPDFQSLFQSRIGVCSETQIHSHVIKNGIEISFPIPFSKTRLESACTLELTLV